MAVRKKENTSLNNREVFYMYGELEWQKVRRLVQQGLKHMAIGRELGIDRRTVKRLLCMPELPRPSHRDRTSILDNFKPIIEGWLKDAPHMWATIRRLSSL